MSEPDPLSPNLTGSDAERVALALDSGAVLGTWVWHVPTDRTTTDDRFARTFGLDPASCRAGLPLGAVIRSIHPEDLPRVEQAIAAALQAGGRFSAEYRVRRFDGVYRWLEASGRCDLDPAGQPVRFPGVLIDIHDRKLAEEKLRASEAQAREATRLLRAVIEAVPALIYVKDRDGRMQIANAPVMELIGKPWPQVERRTDAEFLDDTAQGERVMQTDRRLMQTGGSEALEEIVGYDSAGPRIWLSHKTAFRDETGAVVGLVGTSVDITARKRAEQALAASELQLRQLIDNLFVFVGILDLDGTLREANRAPLDGAGIPREDVIGRKFWDCYWWAYDPAVQHRVRQAVADARAGATIRFDVPIRWRAGTRITIDFQVAPLRNDRGEIVQIIPSGVDVTARADAETQRQVLIDELNHRVKNLFSVACGMVDMESRRAESPRAMAAAVNARLIALARAHALIHPAAGPGQTAAAALADLVAAIVAPHAVPEDNRIERAGPPVTLAPAQATALALILYELATNAAKYGALSSPHGRLAITWRQSGPALTLEWQESGGPPVTGPPPREGFGTKLARLTAAGQLAGAIAFTWNPDGVHVALTARL
jgi:PAS domain S-box-containing protein